MKAWEWVAALLCLIITFSPARPVHGQVSSMVLLPLVSAGETVALSDPLIDALFPLFRDDERQQRPVEQIAHHLLLKQAALILAESAVSRQVLGTRQPDGRDANDIVRETGYTLPGEYSPGHNYVASIGLYPDANAAWAGFTTAATATHVLGLNSFYAGQTQVGMGTARWDDHSFAVVIVTAPPEQ
jgi:hypothetical protein